MIRFLIDTTIRKRDVSGNCYHFTCVTSTKTGKSLTVNSGWGSDGGNIKAFLRRMNVEWNEMHYSEAVLPARQYDRIEKGLQNTIFEHELTTENVLELEKEPISTE